MSPQRHRLVVEYHGARYCGWQRQDGQKSVQEELEQALAICLRASVPVTGAGRTDAGVHAEGQVAHFDHEAPLDVRRIERSLNALLPPDIAVRRLEACAPGFHARYSALARAYRYQLTFRPRPLQRETAWHPGFRAQAGLFRAELEAVRGRHDFTPFSIPRQDGKSTLCEVLRTEVEEGEDRLTVHLEADRFLHRMVRAIVGACYEVGRGHLPPGTVKSIFDGTFRGEHVWAPAEGLCLVRVRYPDDYG